MEKSHRCSPTIAITVKGDNDTVSNSQTLPSASDLFQRCSFFWSPLHLTVVPVDIDGTPNNDDKTIQGGFNLTVKTAHDPLVLAELTLSENSADETQIVWTNAMKD